MNDKENVVQWNTVQPKKEILSHTITCMNLEDIMLSEEPVIKGQYCMTLPYEVSKVVKMIER